MDIKRFTALALAIMMMVSILPTNALAEWNSAYDALGATANDAADAAGGGGTYSMQVGETLTITGSVLDDGSDTRWQNHTWTTSEGESVVRLTATDGQGTAAQTAEVEGLTEGTAVITHRYGWGNPPDQSEAFTVLVGNISNGGGRL